MVEMIGIYISVPLYTIVSLLLGATVTASVFMIHVAVVPLVFKYSKTFRRSLIFANFVQWPLHIDFDKPSKSGIDGARNLNLEFESKVDKCQIKLGIWHILPKSVYERLKGSFEGDVDANELHRLMDRELVNSKTPIIYYCHGNSNSRATNHRILLYKFLQRMEFHIIALDYRGYGDSTKVCPTEAGVVEDAGEVYDWLVNKTQGNAMNSPPIFVWGHSLGTGISSHLLGNMAESKLPRGLILEAPFSNLADEVRHHPLSKLVTWLPYYDTTFVEPFRTYKEHLFQSDTHLAKTSRLPVLILHAKDDVVVPFIVGLKLYRSILKSRADGGAVCKLHVYETCEDLGHKYICLAKDLDLVVGEFVNAHI